MTTGSTVFLHSHPKNAAAAKKVINLPTICEKAPFDGGRVEIFSTEIRLQRYPTVPFCPHTLIIQLCGIRSLSRYPKNPAVSIRSLRLEMRTREIPLRGNHYYHPWACSTKNAVFLVQAKWRVRLSHMNFVDEKFTYRTTLDIRKYLWDVGNTHSPKIRNTKYQKSNKELFLINFQKFNNIYRYFSFLSIKLQGT